MPHFCGRTHTRRGQRDYDTATGIEQRTQDHAIAFTDSGFIEPTHQEIAELAYSYWEARGCTDGSEWEDWFRAERVLRGLKGRP